MKKQILTLTLAVAALASCTKNVQNPTNVKLAEHYFYYVVDRDMDDATIATQIFLISNGKDTLVNTKTVAGGDDCHGDNASSPKCKSMPVKFVNVSFEKTSAVNVTGVWTAAIEANVKQYELWRSTDGVNYKIVQTLAPKGQGTTYTIVDDMSK